ncbi:unnamed protein product [Sphagnum jensenii]|uniref:Uncharacterized protein n=1 Tax=Sphagnum jensenii TaxID=128206 RepID=A0ABP0V7N6_9BRYO
MASVVSGSLPISRGSVVDSELSHLIHQYPNQTRAFLHKQFDTSREHGPDSHLSHQNHIRAPFDGLSHYQETYIPKSIGKQERPTHEVRKYVRPVVPMSSTTGHMEDFINMDPALWHRQITTSKANNETQIVNDSSWSSGDALRSSYQEDYPHKELQVIWKDAKDLKLPGRIQKAASNMKMENTSVTKSDYKPPWLQPNSKTAHQMREGPYLRFGELPAFASLIFPTEVKLGPTESTSQLTYKNPHLHDTSFTVPEAAKPPEANLHLTGDQDFTTTHRQTYTNDVVRAFNDERLKHQVVETTQLNDKHHKREKFVSETQFSRDYKPYGKMKRPQYVRVVASDFNLFDTENAFGNGQNGFKSVMTSSFPGHDARNNPIPKSFKKDNEKYVPPEVKFDVDTVTHSDFQPIDLSKISGNQSIKGDVKKHLATMNSGEFSGKTVSKEVYKVRLI